MSQVIYSWRAILWSMIVTAIASRTGPPDYVTSFADDVLKAFDARFKVEPTGIYDRSKP